MRNNECYPVSLENFFPSKERKKHRQATKNLLSILSKHPAGISPSSLSKIEAKAKNPIPSSRPALDLLDLVEDYALVSDEQVMVLLQDVWITLYRYWKQQFADQDFYCQTFVRFLGTFDRAVDRNFFWQQMNLCEVHLLYIRDHLHFRPSARVQDCEPTQHSQTTLLDGARRFYRTVDSKNRHRIIGVPRIGKVESNWFYKVRDTLRSEIDNELEAVVNACDAFIPRTDLKEAIVLIQRGKPIAASFALNLLCDRLHIFPVNASIVKLLMQVWISLCAYEDGTYINSRHDRAKAAKHKERRKQCTEGRRQVYQWAVYHDSNDKPNYWTRVALW